ncbi:hypothetical protein ACHAXT_004003 [Thalassiosira profunda]
MSSPAASPLSGQGAPEEGAAPAVASAAASEEGRADDPPSRPDGESETRAAEEAKAEEGTAPSDCNPVANAAVKQEEKDGPDEPASEQGAGEGEGAGAPSPADKGEPADADAEEGGKATDAADEPTDEGAAKADAEPAPEESKTTDAPPAADDGPPSPAKKKARSNAPVVAHKPKTARPSTDAPLPAPEESKTTDAPPAADDGPPSPAKKKARSNAPVVAHKPKTARPSTDAPLQELSVPIKGEDDVSSVESEPKKKHRPPPQPIQPPAGLPGMDAEAARTWSETIFPMKLYDILCTPQFSNAVAWMPHGRSWRVLDKDLFVREICPRYFAQTRYESFIRQVNGWGFKRLRREGADRNSYWHEHFLRGYPNLIDHMSRPKPGEKTRDFRNEPDFYALPPMPQLPPPDPSRPRHTLAVRRVGRPAAAHRLALDPMGAMAGMPPMAGGAGYFAYPPPMSPPGYAGPPLGPGGPGAGPGGPFGYPPAYIYPPPMGPGSYPYGLPPGTPQGEGKPLALGAPPGTDPMVPPDPPGMPQGPGMPPGAPPGAPPSMYSYPNPPMYGDPSQYYGPPGGAVGGLPATPSGVGSAGALPGMPPGPFPGYYPYPGSPPSMMAPGMGPPGAPGMPPGAPGMPTGAPGASGLPPDASDAPPGMPQQDAQEDSGPFTTL